MTPAPETVTLTPAELMISAHVANMRRVNSVKVGRPNRYGFDGDNAWDVDIKGACAECAVSKYLGRYWIGMGTIGKVRACDVAPGVEVRWSKHATGCLILHPEDSDRSPFVFVTGSDLVYTLHGWIPGCDGKQRKWWTDPKQGRPAYFVTQSALRPMAELLALLACLKVPA